MGTIFISTFLKSVIFGLWAWFKNRKSRQPIPLKLRNGVHVPWGFTHKVDHYGRKLADAWLVVMAVLLSLVAIKAILGTL